MSGVDDRAGAELLTVPGRAGVAVLRVRGDAARARLAQLTGAELPGPGEVRVRRLRSAAAPEASPELIDEVLVVSAAADAYELHVHGSPAVVERVCAGFETHGRHGVSARPLDADALEDLASAPSEAGARMLLDQARGALRRTLARLSRTPLERRMRACAALRERARIASYLLHPRRVLLAGPPNAGKSTLFNLLVGEQRALVGAAAGTTRDLIEAPARLGPWPIVAVDSAGFHALDATHARAELDRAAQALARRELARADLVLWCDPTGAVQPDELRAARSTVLHTHADLAPPKDGRTAARMLSALEAPAAALVCVEAAFCAAFDLPPTAYRRAAAVPFRDEHERLLIELEHGFEHEPARVDWLRRLGGAAAVEGPASLL